MWIIRDAQMEVLADERVTLLCRWLHPHLRIHFSEHLESVRDEALASLIERSVARALALGATSSLLVGQFVHLRVIFGVAFETLPWSAEILADYLLDGDRKIALLTARAEQILESS